MSTSTTPWWKGIRGWILVSLLGPIIVALVNDVGVNHAIDAINARAFPPHADIQGVLVSKQRSVGNLRVELDGGAPIVSSADGSFTFTDVVRGVHHLSVRDQRMLICENCTNVDITPQC